MAILSFPSSPSTNQTYTVGSKTWIYNGTAWDLQLANTVSLFIQANAAFDRANTANVTAQAAFDKANVAYNDASAGSVYANSAFSKANIAFNDASAASTYANAAFSKANSANTLAQTGYDRANTAVNDAAGAGTYANAAFAKANSANVTAQAAFDKANQTAQLAFTTVLANGVSVIADANNDTITLTPANGIGIFANGATDAVIINLTTSGVTSGSYGDSATVTSIIVDAYGRVTGASNTSIRSGTTSQTGIVQLTDSISSTSTTTAATPNSVKTAYDLAATKYATTGGAITGDVTITGNLTISGNLTSFSANNIVIDDSIIYIANNNSANVTDIGIVGHFVDSKYQHTGLIRDASDGRWKLFSNVVSEPTTTLDFTNAVYDTLQIGRLETTTSNVSGTSYTGNVNVTTTVDWPAAGYAPPSLTTRSTGTKLTLYPSLSSTSVDYAIGINGGVLWSSIPAANTSYSFKWYGGESEIASLSGDGTLTAISVNITSTTAATSNTTGALKVAGGIGVKGNVYASNVSATGDVIAGLGDGPVLGGTTNPIIAAIGNTNNYIQSYIINYANTGNASADIVVYPNNGQDGSGWVDMGITSNNYNQSTFSVTGRNEGYLFMSAPIYSGTSGNLVIATDSTGTYNTIEFVVGGFAKGKTNSNVKFTTGTSSTSNTTGAIQVQGGIGVKGNVVADGAYIGVDKVATMPDVLAIAIALG